MDKYINANIIFSKFCKSYMELKKDLPIRPSEMGVLNIIVKRTGLYTPLMISELLEVTKVMITNHINVLEKKRYITRQYLPNDKRSFYVIPTEKAKLLVEEVQLKLNVKIQKIENELGNDKFEELINLLKISKNCMED